MTTLYLDLETYSETPITSGTHAYAERAEILLLAWAIDDGPVSVLDLTNGDDIPAVLVPALQDDSVLLCAHNSHFDRTVLRHYWPKIPLPTTRWRDTMVKAMAHSLPGALGALGEALGLPADKAKDKEGKQMVMLFCKPRPKNNKLRRATRETHPAEWAKFIAYAAQDIEAMRTIDKMLPSWNYGEAELALWHLDQRINDRGVAIDMALVNAAIEAVAKAQEQLAERTDAMTDGAVQTATQRDAMVYHIFDKYGKQMPDMQMATVSKLLADETIQPGLRELLNIRLEASTTSTAKYKKLATAVSSDGRLRGALQFNGAARTGRWSGRLFQPQNLPRPTLKQVDIDAGIEALKAGCADLCIDNVMELTSSALRGCIIAPQGKKLVISDLSNIEGRVQAWLAGEDWKLQAFKDFDNGTGHDLYKLAYAKSFGVTPGEVSKDQRQVGKVQELAFGYQGGVGACVTFARAYGLDFEKLAQQVISNASPETLQAAKDTYQWMLDAGRDTADLPARAWIACETLKRAWRSAHPNIEAMWHELESAVKRAVSAPGHTMRCGATPVRRDGNWLRIRLPSGRYLCYPSVKLGEDGAVTYMGQNQFTRKWSRLGTYGGKLFENMAQAVARDVMAYNMHAIERAGYAIVLTVHDEVICEAPDTGEYNAERLSELLSTPPTWALDIPLAASGFETDRYKKD